MHVYLTVRAPIMQFYLHFINPQTITNFHTNLAEYSCEHAYLQHYYSERSRCWIQVTGLR